MECTMYFLTTTDIIHPETLDPIVRSGTVLTPENLRTLDVVYGVDNVPCVWCRDMGVIELIVNDHRSTVDKLRTAIA